MQLCLRTFPSESSAMIPDGLGYLAAHEKMATMITEQFSDLKEQTTFTFLFTIRFLKF